MSEVEFTKELKKIEKYKMCELNAQLIVSAFLALTEDRTNN